MLALKIGLTKISRSKILTSSLIMASLSRINYVTSLIVQILPMMASDVISISSFLIPLVVSIALITLTAISAVVSRYMTTHVLGISMCSELLWSVILCIFTKAYSDTFG